MSSKRERGDGSDSGEDGVVSDKRKPNRACDYCRKRKHRCDGDTSEGPCSNCRSLSLRCTYLEQSSRRAIPKGYVQALEARVALLLSLVAQDRPNVDLERLLGGPLVLDPASFNVRRVAGQSKPITASDAHDLQWQRSKGSHSPSVVGGSGFAGPSSTTSRSSTRPASRTGDTRQAPAGTLPDQTTERGDSEDELVRRFTRLNKPDEIQFRSYLGKSSNVPLISSSIAFKYGTDAEKFGQECALHPLATEFPFQTPSWEHPPEGSVTFGASVLDDWPDDTLASSLIDLYFAHANEAMPLLQRSHFLSQYASQLYFRDEGFARMCLLVFARGAGYSNDLRVRSINEDGDYEPVRSAGWIYFHAMSKIARPSLDPIVLSDFQCAVLSATFLQIQGSRGDLSWLIVGAGLKAAIGVGSHRRESLFSKDVAENELVRRAFWCLYLLDVEYSCGLGRPMTLDEDEFDVELEFDHAFWQDGAESYPSSPPSAEQAFCLEVELARILARTCTLLYGIKRPHKSSLVIVNDLEEQINEWTATVPTHLRWDASRPNSLEFRLSGKLHMELQKTLTYIHRPFLPSPQHPVSASPTSVTAAFKAALESVAVYDQIFQKTQEISQASFFVPNIATSILLLCLWAGPATHKHADPSEAIEAVEKATASMLHVANRFSGFSSSIMTRSVLAAPRVDYLVESASSRKDRERRVAQALEFHRQGRLESAERSSRSPSARSNSSPAVGGSTPYGFGGADRSSGPSSIIQHPSSTENVPPAMPFDLGNLFGGDFLFPDLPIDHDPAMSLFFEQPPSSVSHSLAQPSYKYPYPQVVPESIYPYPAVAPQTPPSFPSGGPFGGMPNVHEGGP